MAASDDERKSQECSCDEYGTPQRPQKVDKASLYHAAYTSTPPSHCERGSLTMRRWGQPMPSPVPSRLTGLGAVHIRHQSCSSISCTMASSPQDLAAARARFRTDAQLR